MLGTYNIRVRPGLGRPCRGLVERQESVLDVSIGDDGNSRLLSIGDIKVFRVVHVIGDTVI